MSCCKIERNLITKYSGNDFNNEIKLVYSSPMQTAEYDKYDVNKYNTDEITIMAIVKLVDTDFDIEGSLAGGSSTLNATAFMINKFLDIKKNVKSWYIIFRNEKYQLQHIENLDFKNQYMILNAIRKP